MKAVIFHLRRFTLIAVLATIAASPVSGEPKEGAVVEEVARGWAAERAGFRPGDLLLSWSRGKDGGPLRSPFDLGQLEIEQAPRGVVTLRGTRERENREWVLPPGRWGLEARPTLPKALLVLHRQARNRISAGDSGAGYWRSATAAADRRKDPLRAAWFQARLARELAGAGRWAEADAALEQAVQRLAGSQPAAAAQLLRDQDWNKILRLPARWGRAEAYLRRALSLEPEESLSTAWDLSYLGMIARERGDYAVAEDLVRKAYEIQKKLALEGAGLTWMTRRELAIIHLRRGDLVSEATVLLEVLELLERLAPESLELAVILNDLGENARRRGDLLAAEERLQRALTLLQKLNPKGPEFAHALGCLGLLDVERADLASAQERLQRALALVDTSSDSLYLGYFLVGLAYLAETRNDLVAAQDYYQRSLQVSEKLAHDAPDNAYYGFHFQWSLAVVARSQGNLAKADEHFKQALEILDKDRSWPEGYFAAKIYYFRALMATGRGDLTLAAEMHGRTLAILEEQSPNSLTVANSLQELGTIALKRGDLTNARELFQRAFSIYETMAPGSTWVGLSLNRLGQTDHRAGRLETATEHFCRATEIFDRQRKSFSRITEGRSAFGGTTAESYRDCLAALVDTGRAEAAFGAMERGRARSFLDLLTERELRWTADLPLELARDRKQTDAEFDRTQAALYGFSPLRDKAEVDRLLIRLRTLRIRQEEIAAKIRQISPRAAALQDPRPLDLAGTRAALDPGTVLLA